MKIKSLVIIFLVLTFTFCKKEEASVPESATVTNASSYPCDSAHTQRVGCICNDGTSSTATGSGACSHHDGVKYWLCK